MYQIPPDSSPTAKCTKYICIKYPRTPVRQQSVQNIYDSNTPGRQSDSKVYKIYIYQIPPDSSPTAKCTKYICIKYPRTPVRQQRVQNIYVSNTPGLQSDSKVYKIYMYQIPPDSCPTAKCTKYICIKYPRTPVRQQSLQNIYVSNTPGLQSDSKVYKIYMYQIPPDCSPTAKCTKYICIKYPRTPVRQQSVQNICIKYPRTPVRQQSVQNIYVSNTPGLQSDSKVYQIYMYQIPPDSSSTAKCTKYICIKYPRTPVRQQSIQNICLKYPRTPVRQQSVQNIYVSNTPGLRQWTFV